MKRLRWLGLYICNVLFRSLFFFAASIIATMLVFGNSNQIREALATSQAYERTIPALLDSVPKNSEFTGSIPLGDPKVKQIITTDIPPSLLRESGERIIDGTYEWLDGKTQTPQFTLDFTKSKQLLAHDLSTYAFSRLLDLPLCGAPPATIDPFTATCRPPAQSYFAAQESMEHILATSPDFLPKTVLGPADMPKGNSGKALYEQYDYAPSLYQLGKRAPYIFTSLLLVLALLIILLNKSRRYGVHQVGYATLLNGIFLAISPIILVYLLPSLSKSFQHQLSSGSAANIMSDMVFVLTREFNIYLICIGILVAMIGAIILVIERLIKAEPVYHELPKKAGLVSGVERKHAEDASTGLKRERVPLETSESITPVRKKQSNKKYRTIPTKDI